jgi:hypothetical protein
LSSGQATAERGEIDLALLLLLLAGIVLGLGFVSWWLFVPAAVLLVLWVAGWFVRLGEGRWYYW